jgi:hypothetical protein
VVGGVAVETLPVGYRVVGGISVAYAVLMGLVLVLVASAALNQSPPRGALDWLGIAAFVLSPVALFTSGCLLFARREPALRLSAWASMIAAAVLLCKAGLVSLATVQELQHPTSSTGVLVIFNIPLIIMPASMWAVIVFATGVNLVRRIRSVKGLVEPR